MMWLMRAGGAPSFVIVFFGLVALLSAIRFAWRPERGRMPYILGLSAAVLFSSVAGVGAALATVSQAITQNDEWAHNPDLHLILIAGIGESMAPMILGCSILTAIALVSSVGLRRLPAA